MKNIYIAIALITLTGCGANYHLRRARKHLAMAELLGAPVLRDTIYKTISVITEGVRTDTIIKYKTLFDTLEVTKDKIKIRVKIDSVTKTVYIHGECPPDTVYKTVPVSIQTDIKPKPTFMDNLSDGVFLILVFVVMAVGFVIYKLVKKKPGD